MANRFLPAPCAASKLPPSCRTRAAPLIHCTPCTPTRGRRAWRWGNSADDATLTAAIEAVGLENAARVLKLYPFEMSGGMLQRMMIAMAVLCESPFIIADEPTTDLDVVAQARILDLLESIMQKQAPGMLLVTHDMGVVARLADDVAVMSDGKIVEQGDVETLFNAPKHAVTRSLVSAHLALYGMELAS